MIYELIRRDATWRTLPKWIILAPLVSAQVTSFRCVYLCESGGTRLFGSEFAEAALWMLILWVPVSIFVVASGVSQRVSDMDMALPIPARKLWSAQLLARLLSGGLILTVSTLAVYLARFGINTWVAGTRGTPITLDIDPLVPGVFAGFILTVVLIQSFDSPLRKSRGGLKYAIFSAAVLLGAWVTVAALSVVPMASVLVPLIIAVAAGVRTLRALPPVFAVAPREPEGKSAPRVADRSRPAVMLGEARGGHHHAWLVLRTMMRAYARNISKPFFAYPFLFLVGVLLGGGLVEDEVLRFLNVSLTVYMLLIFAALSIPGLYLLDALPIPRRRLFAVLTLPSLVALSAGYFSGLARDSMPDSRNDLVRFKEEDGCYCLNVPIRDCEISWDGNPPENASPWGESRWAWRIRALPWHPVVIYSPFTTPDSSSVDFVALQVSRAIGAVYGASVSPAEISERYLAEDPDGRVILREGGMSFRSDYPELEPGYRGPVFPVLFTLVGLPWLIILSIYFRTVRVGISSAVRKIVLWGFAALCLGFYVAPIPLVEAGLIQLWTIVALVEILVRHAGATPGGTALVWIVSGLLLSAAYWLAQRQFERIEAPADPGKISPQLL